MSQKRFKFTKSQMKNILANTKIKSPLEISVAKTIEAQQDWLNKEMKRILPPAIYRDAMSDEPECRQRAADYCREKNIRIQEADGGMSKQIWEGDKMIAEFKFMGVENLEPPKAS